MRRWGTILMILGANLAVASVTAAFWRASFECAVRTGGQRCPDSAVQLFLNEMISAHGIAYWLVIVVGIVIFMRGKRMRAEN